MDTATVMENRRKALRRSNKHWRKSPGRKDKGRARNLKTNDKRKAMDTDRAPNFDAIIPVNAAEDFPVDARKLHAALGVGRVFRSWIRSRIAKCGFTAGRDYSTATDLGHPEITGASAFSERIDYSITLDMAKHLAMLERTDMGRKVRAYFIECEKRLHEREQPPFSPDNLPTHLETAEALVEALLLAQRLKARNAELEPKGQFYDDVTASVDDMSLRAAAKSLGSGQNRLCAELRRRGILQNSKAHWNEPYQQVINRGYFRIIVGSHERGGENHTHRTTRVTGKGLAWLHRIFNVPQQQALVTEEHLHLQAAQ